jgi:WD40 repeat protein
MGDPVAFDGTLRPPPPKVRDAVYDPERERIVAQVAASHLAVWSPDADAPKQVIRINDKPTILLDLRDGVRAYREHGEIVLVSVPDMVRLDAVSALDDAPVLAAFSSDARRWALSRPVGEILVRDLKNGQTVAQLATGAKPLQAMRLSPDGQRLVTVDSDGTAHLWDFASGKALAKADARAADACSILFDESGGRVIVLSGGGHLTVWSTRGDLLATGALDMAVNRSRRGIPSGLVVALLPQDGRLAIGAGAIIELRDPLGKRPAAQLKGHDETFTVWRDLRAIQRVSDAEVTDLAVASDGERMISASDDGSARIWYMASGDTVSVLSGHGVTLAARPQPVTHSTSEPEYFEFGSVHSVAIAKGMNRVVTASADGTVRLWPFFPSTQALVDHVKSSVTRCMTPKQRQSFRLEPEPPGWCVKRRLWPYHTEDWQGWLSASDNGEPATMPEVVEPTE